MTSSFYIKPCLTEHFGCVFVLLCLALTVVKGCFLYVWVPSLPVSLNAMTDLSTLKPDDPVPSI